MAIIAKLAVMVAMGIPVVMANIVMELIDMFVLILVR